MSFFGGLFGAIKGAVVGFATGGIPGAVVGAVGGAVAGSSGSPHPAAPAPQTLTRQIQPYISSQAFPGGAPAPYYQAPSVRPRKAKRHKHCYYTYDSTGAPMPKAQALQYYQPNLPQRVDPYGAPIAAAVGYLTSSGLSYYTPNLPAYSPYTDLTYTPNLPAYSPYTDPGYVSGISGGV